MQQRVDEKDILGGMNHTRQRCGGWKPQGMRGESEGSLAESRMGLEGGGLGVWRGKGARTTGHVQIPGLLLVQLHFLCATVDAIEGHKDVGWCPHARLPCPHRHFVQHLSREGCESWALASTITPAIYYTSLSLGQAHPPSSTTLKEPSH